jgi:4-amino-4-deoxy-L-arabinose transferase-like glycosyltransferase
VLASVLLFSNLDENVFWDDEAHTAIYAKNILKAGYPTAWDGRNLAAYRSGLHLNSNFVNTKETWLQHYLVASSFLIFGTTTFAARLPFVLFGLLCLALLPLLAKHLLDSYRLGLLASLLLALNPSFLLFSRNCRYYSVCMLLTLLAIVAYKRLDAARIKSSLFLSVILALLFFTHTLTFLAVFVGLSFMLLVEQDRRHWRGFFISGFLASFPCALWVVYAKTWKVSLYEIVRYAYPGFSLGKIIQEPLHDSILDRVNLLAMTLRNINSLDFFPAIFLLPLFYWVLRSRKYQNDPPDPVDRLSNAYGLPLLQLLMFVVAYTAICAFTSPQLMGRSLAVETRYLAPLLPIFSLISAFVIRRIFLFNRPLAAIVLLLFVLSNVLSLKPFYDRGLNPDISLSKAIDTRLISYLREMRGERTTSYEAAIKLVEKHVQKDETVFFFPEYTILPHMFYQSEQILFSSVVIPDGSSIWHATRSKLPAYLTQHPIKADWIMTFGKPTTGLRHVLQAGFVLQDSADVYWGDTTRPEPEKHTFKQVSRFDKQSEGIRLWRRVEQDF